jgi:hypothetical protein
MREGIEPLNDQDRGKRQRQKRQTGHVAQSDIVSKKIAGVCAKNTGETQRGPVARAKRRNVRSLHNRIFPNVAATNAASFVARMGPERALPICKPDRSLKDVVTLQTLTHSCHDSGAIDPWAEVKHLSRLAPLRRGFLLERIASRRLISPNRRPFPRVVCSYQWPRQPRRGLLCSSRPHVPAMSTVPWDNGPDAPRTAAPHNNSPKCFGHEAVPVRDMAGACAHQPMRFESKQYFNCPVRRT